MLRWLKDTWIGSAPVEFESAFDVADSVEHLRAATKRSVFSAMAHEAAVGTVKEARVSLQRAIPMMGNSFKPIFVGRFEERGGKVVLCGSFQMHLFARLFMTVWFGLLILVAIGMLAGALHPADGSGNAAIGLVFVIGMIGAGLGMVRLGQWFSRHDPAWLSEVIRAALGTPTVPGTAIGQAQSLAFGLPANLLAFALLFAVGGAGNLVSAVTGARPNGIVTSFVDPSVQRLFDGVFGAMMLACAYGIFRRLRFAWWLGFGPLVYGGIYAVGASDPSRPSPPLWAAPPQPFMIALTIMMLLVFGIWTWWWYAQRDHFNR